MSAALSVIPPQMRHRLVPAAAVSTTSIRFDQLVAGTGAHVHIGALPTTLSTGQDFTSPSGTPVGGWTSVEVHADGSVRFRGDFHDSGFAPMEFNVVDMVKDADNVADSLKHSGGLVGTISGGPRDGNWDSKIQNNLIRDNWRSFVSNMQVAGHANTNLDLGWTLSAALKVLGVVETVVSLV